MTDIDRELRAQVFGEVYLPLVAHLTLLALLLTLVWSLVPTRALAWWGGAIVGVSAMRTILWNVVRRRNLQPRGAVLTARATMLVLGLAWGVGAAFIFRYLPVADVALILLGLTGLLSGGLATLAADRWTFPIYAMAMFGPPALVLGLTGPDRFYELAVVLMLIYLAFAIRLHVRSHDSLRERLRVEEALREGERRLSEAQALAHVGNWEWNMQTKVVTWSGELRRIYGVPQDAPAGYAEFLACVHPDDHTRVKALIERQFVDHQPMEYEWRVCQPGGDVRYLHSRQMVVKGGDGQPLRMIGTSHDITDVTRARDEVKVLRGILPICANCKRIKNESGGWEQVESYVRDHTNAEFTHGLCPDCAKKTWG